MFAVLAAVFILCQFQRSVTGVLGPTLRDEIGLAADQLGWVTGTFFWGVAIMQIPSGILFDRYGPRLTIAISLFVGVAGGFLFAFGASFWALMIGMALLGLGTSAVFMGAVVVIGRWWPPQHFATMAALMMSLGYVGNLLATQPFVELVKLTGWRAGFGAAIAGMLVCAVAILLVVRDSPAGSAWASRAPEPLSALARGLREVFRHPSMIGLCAAALVGYATSFAIRGLWLGTYLLDVHGLGEDARGTILLAMAVAGTIGIFLAGWLAGRLRSPRLAVIGFIATSATCLLVMALWRGIPLPALIGVLLVFSTVASFFPAVLEHTRRLFEDRLRGRSLTSVNVWVFVGVGITQPVTGYILDAFPALPGGGHGEDAYRTLFAFLVGPATAGLVLYTLFARITPFHATARP